MKPLTIEDVANLPAAYSIDADFADYVDFYGPSLRQSYLQTYVVFLYNSYYVSNVFNHVLWGSVGFIILVAMLLRLFNHLGRSTRRAPSFLKSIRTFFVKHFYLSATIGKHTMISEATRGSIQIPVRVHGILISIYVVANFIIIFTAYQTIVPNIYWQDLGYTWNQLLRGFSDRTGILSFGSTPLVILLAGRNSPVSALTGASYSTLQIYHRWVARITVMMALFHAIGFTLNEILYSYDEYFASFQLPYWNHGIVAMVGGGMLVFLSLRRMREIAYEVFLIGHIVGAILWVVGCYFHVYYLETDYYLLKYIYASIAIWAFDRLVRFLNLVYLNLPVLRRHRSRPFAAEGYIIRTGDFVRLRIAPARSWPASFGGPGTYVFISSPQLTQIWQNHPFTITWPTGMPTSADRSSTNSSEDLKVGEGKTMTSAESIFEGSALDEAATSFELVLKAYAGFTKTLAKSLQSTTTAPGSEQGVASAQKVKLLVEGPYGSSIRLQTHTSILLVAGGSGVSATIAHLADLAKKRGTVERITVVWAIRDTSACDTFAPYFQRLQELFANAPAGFLTIHVHITGRKVVLEEKEKSNEDEDTHADSLLEVENRLKVKSSAASVTLHIERPRVQEYLDSVISQADTMPASIAVSACGPIGLCDGSREAVKARVGRTGNASLEYHEELFTW